MNTHTSLFGTEIHTKCTHKHTLRHANSQACPHLWKHCMHVPAHNGRHTHAHTHTHTRAHCESIVISRLCFSPIYSHSTGGLGCHSACWSFSLSQFVMLRTLGSLTVPNGLCFATSSPCLSILSLPPFFLLSFPFLLLPSASHYTPSVYPPFQVG